LRMSAWVSVILFVASASVRASARVQMDAQQRIRSAEAEIVAIRVHRITLLVSALSRLHYACVGLGP
jgi:hypothetical protein